MKLSECLTPQRVLLLEGANKAEALHELVAALAESGVGVGQEELEQAILKREQLLSTGIGQGIAVHHVRMPSVPRLAMAVGVSRNGIPDYGSFDDEPVRIVVMIVAPAGAHEDYIRLLAQTVEALKKPDARRAVIEAEAPEVVYRTFAEAKR